MNDDELNRLSALMTRRYESGTKSTKSQGQDKVLASNLGQQNYNNASQAPKDVCAICMGEFRDSSTILLHPICHHLYHYECLTEWLKSKASCPLCRRGTRSNLMQEMANFVTNQEMNLVI